MEKKERSQEISLCHHLLIYRVICVSSLERSKVIWVGGGRGVEIFYRCSFRNGITGFYTQNLHFTDLENKMAYISLCSL